MTVTDKYLDAGLLALREIDESREGQLMHPNEAAALLRDREAMQSTITDLRNRLNLSEKLQGRFPVDAVQPDPKEPPNE